MQRLIVFLDIDGVVATKNSILSMWREYLGDSFRGAETSELLKELNLNHPRLGSFRWPFDRDCCRNIHIFQRSLPNVRVEYVISSTWRLGRDRKELTDLFNQKGLHLNEIIGRTGNKGERGLEILEWLEVRGEQDTPYITIDDECTADIVEHIGEEHCIETTFMWGFDDEKFDEAITKAKRLLYA